ncbi:MAG: hypothetical protein HY071_02865 [Chloroflexi bacterium]|nr:hypothetical protein [Chloroflexota bacterium]
MGVLGGHRQPVLIWLSVLSEIEGLAFIAVGVMLHRADLFIDAQTALLPAAVLVATATAIATIWRRPRASVVEQPAEELMPVNLASRIGAVPVPARNEQSDEGRARWRRALDTDR